MVSGESFAAVRLCLNNRTNLKEMAMKSKIVRAFVVAMVTATLLLAGTAAHGAPGGDSVIVSLGQ